MDVGYLEFGSVGRLGESQNRCGKGQKNVVYAASKLREQSHGFFSFEISSPGLRENSSGSILPGAAPSAKRVIRQYIPLAQDLPSNFRKPDGFCRETALRGGSSPSLTVEAG
jgi:hypothetical protein